MAWTSFDKPAMMFRFSNTGGANAETKIHPTQKPVELYKYLFRRLANKGDKVIDTHGGSMGIAIAAYDLEFDLTVCENNMQHFSDGKRRYENHVANYSPASDQPISPSGQVKLF